VNDDTPPTLGLLEPRANPLLIGQDAAESALLSSLARQRLAHAWLLTGPRGIGKATLAFRFARRLLGGDEATARRIAAGSHPDLLVLERKVNPDSGKRRAEIIVDDIRAATSFLRLTASGEGARIVIIDAADDLNANSANALLKLLEEPPENALLLLVAHAPGRLLATIRSRCRVLTLRPLADEFMEQLLAAALPERTAAERTQLIGLASGSIGRALDLADRGGMAARQAIDELLAPLPELDPLAVQAFADQAIAGEDAAGMLRMMLEMLAAWVARTAKQASRSSGVEPWLAAWDRIGELMRRGEALGLDRRMVVLEAVLAIETAARATPR
jgi:DNA polymerase-3 subunit delta'